MTRDELMRTRCWSCWWKECGQCFREGLAHIGKDAKGWRQGEEITPDLIKRCEKIEGFLGKRTVLERAFPRDMLVIASEEAKKRERDRGY